VIDFRWAAAAMAILCSGVTTQSDATTMNSMGIVLPTQQSTSINGTVGTTPVAGTATSTGVVYIPPTGANVTTMQQPSIPIEIDWRREPSIPIEIECRSRRHRANGRFG